MTPEKAAELVFKASSNFPLDTNCDLEATIELWLEVFVDIDDALMDKALNLALKSTRKFPRIADLGDAIDQLRQEMKTKPQPAMIARSKKIDPAITAALAKAKEGGAKELLAGIDMAELLEFASLKFPGISEQSVRRNFNELELAREYSERCFACRYQPNQCLTGGYYIKPRMMPDGWIKNEYVVCGKKREVS